MEATAYQANHESPIVHELVTIGILKGSNDSSSTSSQSPNRSGAYGSSSRESKVQLVLN